MRLFNVSGVCKFAWCAITRTLHNVFPSMLATTSAVVQLATTALVITS